MGNEQCKRTAQSTAQVYKVVGKEREGGGAKREMENEQCKRTAQSTAQVYKVVGKGETTPYNLSLHLQKVVTQTGQSVNLEFKGHASGIFTRSADLLAGAKLRTENLELLLSKGTLFYFSFDSDAFKVTFYNPDDTTKPLGVLRANPAAPAGQPGSGAGKWSHTF